MQQDMTSSKKRKLVSYGESSDVIHWKEKAYAKMKFMKIGTKPDVFYTEEATRYVFTIKVRNKQNSFF